MPSKIEWTDEVWNPIVGCTKCSPGCLNCYAERFACRLAYMGQEKYQKVTGYINEWTHWLGNVYCDKLVLDQPLHWKKPRRIFVCSMSDLFHPKVPFEYIIKVLRIIEQCPQHIFLILTKRPEIAFDFYGGTSGFGLSPPPLLNVHLGVSISNPNEMWKATELSRIPAAVRWISFEPLLADVGEIPLIDGVVVGGESGSGARPMHPDWPRNIRDQCIAEGIPFFFKQWGAYTPDGSAQVIKNDVVFLKDGTLMDTKDVFRNGWQKYYDTPTDCIWMKRVGKKKAGRLLDGKEWNQLPERK